MRFAVIVLLVGCWRTTPRTEPQPPPPPDAAIDASVVDATVAAPVDAAPIDAAPSTSVKPAPRCPGGFIARIIKVEVQGARTVMTVGIGAKQGVTTAWTAMHRNPDIAAPILRVDTHVTLIESTLTYDQVRPSPHVELCPP